MTSKRTGDKETEGSARAPDSFPGDINQVFSDALSRWEQASNEIANRFMATGEFSRGMNSATHVALEIRKTMAEQMARLLAASNLPSRAEIIELHRAVDDMAARLFRIEGMLLKIVDPSAVPGSQVSRPPRTKRPPSTARSS